MKKRGKLIVIDGSDGVGKTTQLQLLIQRLKKEKVAVYTTHFPQDRNVFGKLIRECLAGKHGDFIGIDPYIVSTLYAADRFETKSKIEQWLSDGKTVILDRYASSNQMHQGGKVKDSKKRAEFLRWLDTIEFKIFGIPRPDGIIYLATPLEFSLKLIAERGGADQAERDVQHLADTQKSALSLIKKNNAWHKVECVQSGELLPRSTIHERVYACYRGIVGAK